MKKISRIILVFLLMVSAAAAFVFAGMDDSGRLSDNHDLNVNKTGLSLSDEEFSLGLGESYQCSAFFNNDEMSNIEWSSSDPLVAKISDSGRVTAVSVGETEIQAKLPENIIASAKVWVYDNPTECTADAIKTFATDGSIQSFTALTSLAHQFKCAKNGSVDGCSNLLGNLLKFSDIGAGKGGSPNDVWNELNSALSNAQITDINDDTLKSAALAAYCQGERLVDDVTISFTGDCTFAYFNETNPANMFPAVYKNSGSVTYPFDLTKNVFGSDDITMINFEGTLTQSREHMDKTFYFRGEPSYVNILTNSSVEAVTVENNHSSDYLDRGYNDTLRNLRSANINCTSYSSPATINVNGYRIVMLSMLIMSDRYDAEFKSTIEKYIQQYRDSKTVIIVNIHWGVEGSDTPEPWQIETAHSIIDAGADMIVGHHPHVLQGIECYKGHYIAYSLGNFSFGGNMSAFKPQTIILRALFSQDGSGRMTSRISVVPCYTTSSGSTVNNFRPVPLFGSQGGDVCDKLLSLSTKLEYGIAQIDWSRIP